MKRCRESLESQADLVRYSDHYGRLLVEDLLHLTNAVTIQAIFLMGEEEIEKADWDYYPTLSRRMFPFTMIPSQ